MTINKQAHTIFYENQVKYVLTPSETHEVKMLEQSIEDFEPNISIFGDTLHRDIQLNYERENMYNNNHHHEKVLSIYRIQKVSILLLIV